MMQRITGYDNAYYATVISNMAAIAAMQDVARLKSRIHQKGGTTVFREKRR